MTRNATWWALARSEEVTASKPLAADIGDQPVVLWRDREGVARALEDRCPHRRAPLSLGCILDNGWIQCGYHGWRYDGATGRLTEIPNMKGEQRFPPLYRAQRFAVAEGGGFVRVCLDAGSAPPAAQDAPMARSGTCFVATPHEQYVAALFDDPGLLIAIRAVGFTPYLLSELHEEDGRLVTERSCQWAGLHWPSAFSSDFPLRLLTRADPVTGETELILRDAGMNVLLRAVMAPVPASRGVTAIRWRCEAARVLPGLFAKLLGYGNPLTVRRTVDGAALRVLKPTVSMHGATLRARHEEISAAA